MKVRIQRKKKKAKTAEVKVRPFKIVWVVRLNKEQQNKLNNRDDTPLKLIYIWDLLHQKIKEVFKDAECKRILTALGSEPTNLFGQCYKNKAVVLLYINLPRRVARILLPKMPRTYPYSNYYQGSALPCPDTQHKHKNKFFRVTKSK